MLAAASSAWAQDSVSAGRKTFENRCSGCHGADGNGGELGPPIARRVTNLSDAQIKTTVVEGLPARGMPPNNVSDADMPQLIGYLRSLRPRRFRFPAIPAQSIPRDRKHS